MIFLTLCFLTSYSVALTDTDVQKRTQALKKDANLKFVKLLKSVIDVNEKRFKTIQRLTSLEEKPFTSLRSLAHMQDMDKLWALNPTAIVILNERSLSDAVLPKLLKLLANQDLIPYSVSPSSAELSSQSRDDSTEVTTKLVEWTRKSGEIFCVKQASKMCKRSCVSAYKNTCLRYRCARRMQKRLRKVCKNSCRREFNKGKYEDSDTD